MRMVDLNETTESNAEGRNDFPQTDRKIQAIGHKSYEETDDSVSGWWYRVSSSDIQNVGNKTYIETMPSSRNRIHFSTEPP